VPAQISAEAAAAAADGGKFVIKDQDTHGGVRVSPTLRGLGRDFEGGGKEISVSGEKGKKAKILKTWSASFFRPLAFSPFPPILLISPLQTLAIVTPAAPKSPGHP
jgi:hypothetical protein